MSTLRPISPRGAAPRQAVPAEESEPTKVLGPQERSFLILLGSCLVVAVAIPVPLTKYALAAALGIAYVRYLFAAPHLALSMFIFAFPLLDLLPANVLPIPGMNPQTFLVLSLLVRALMDDKAKEEGVRTPLVAGMLIYVVAVLVGAIHTHLSYGRDILQMLTTAKNQLSVLVVLFFAPRLVREERQRKFVLVSMGVLLFLMSAHTVWDTRDSLASGVILERNRAVGLVAGQPNLYGGWLALCLTVLIAFLFSGTVRMKGRVLLGVCLAFGGIALVYTLSRGAWIALAAAVAAMGLLRNRKILLLGLFAFFVLPSLVSPAVRGRFSQMLDSLSKVDAAPEELNQDHSARTRILQWQYLPEILGMSPVIGHGYRTFPYIWMKHGPLQRPIAAHSSIIEIGVELGILGLIGYLALILPVARRGWALSGARAPPFQKAVGVSALGLCLCLVILDASGTRFRNSEVTITFWVVASLACGPWPEHPSGRRPARKDGPGLASSDGGPPHTERGSRQGPGKGQAPGKGEPEGGRGGGSRGPRRPLRRAGPRARVPRPPPRKLH